MSGHKFTVGEALGFGWNTFKANVGYFLKLMVAVTLVMVVSGWLFGGRGFVLAVIGFLVNQAVLMGLARMSLLWADEAPGRQSLKTLTGVYPPFRVYVRFVATTILSGLAFAAGTILLIVPGIIIGVMFTFCNYLNVDKDAKPIEALKGSAAITRGSRWQVFWLMLAFMIINVGGAILFLVGLFVTVPVTLCAMGYAYRKLMPAEASDTAPAAAI